MTKHTPASFNAAYPDQLVAVCSREQASAILSFDHHRVQVGGRWGVLITYHLIPLQDAQEPLTVRVVFHYADAHPPAPPQAQAVLDELEFAGHL